MIYEYIQNNFVVVTNILFLIVFLATNMIFDKRVTRLFALSISLLIILTITENIDYAMSLKAGPTMLRVWMASIGYALRPFIIYVLILVLKYHGLKERIILAIPGIINVGVTFTALFSGISFSYDAANEFVHGPLGYTPHICSVFYFCIIVFCTVHFFKERNYVEAGVIFAIVVMCVIATVLESIWDYPGLLRAAISLSITFFYLYFCAQSFKRDALTKVLNRHCFYQDAEAYQGKLAAVLSVDLNKLKVINDSEGHAAGDVAIYTTAQCIQKHLRKGCYVYRTGGDEFTVLCLRQMTSIAQIESMIQSILSEMEKTPYRCTIGMAEYREGESFSSLCARADEAMYQEKKK